MTIRIVTDSTCDLPDPSIQKFGISVVPLYINVGKQGWLDGIDITREEFYRYLPSFPEHPTTAVPSPQKFRAIYDALAEEGATQILSIHISSGLSGVVDVARIAAQETKAIPVTVIDSQQLSLGTGFLVEKAAKMAMAGESLEDILAAIHSQIQRSRVFAALDTLEFLRRSGRMNRFMSKLGAMLQIKPILTMIQGLPDTERVRTRERAMKRLIDILRDIGVPERIAILHSNAPERVAELKALAAALLPTDEIIVANITPVIGVHIGPGAYGFAVVTAEN